MKEAYPLEWPLGYKRTANRKSSPFKQSMDRAQRFLYQEVKRLGGTNLIVSSNIPIRKDGMMYADWMNRRIDDPGVAVYFTYNGKEISMCCDQYRSIWENVYALGKGIEALRGMERWGVSDFLDRAFSGFTALPPAFAMGPAKRPWRVVMRCEGSNPTEAMVKERYKKLAKELHPDAGGTTERFQELNEAYEEALKEVTAPGYE